MKPRFNKETNYVEFDDFNINLNNMILSFAKDNTTNKEMNKKQNEMLTAMQHKVINDRTKIETLVINPNNICLGRCVYCYNEKSNNIKPHQMSVEEFEGALDSLKQRYQLPGPFKVVRFFGGEPILNPNWEYFILHLWKAGFIDENTDLLISSGLLFDDDTFDHMLYDLLHLKEVTNVNIKISVSVDFGMESFTRKNIVGVTQQMLVERVVRLCCHNIQTAFTSNITKDFSLDLFKKQTKEAYDSIPSLYKKNLFMRVSIVAHDEYTPTKETVEELADALVDLQKEYPITTNLFSFDFVLDGAKITKIDDDHFLLVYYPFYCGMYSQMIEIFPDGSLGACHMDITNKTSILTKDNIDYKHMFSEECATCSNRLFCRNGCTNRRKLVQDESKRKIYCLWMEKCYMLSWDRVANKYKKQGKDFKEVITRASERRWEQWMKTEC